MEKAYQIADIKLTLSVDFYDPDRDVMSRHNTVYSQQWSDKPITHKNHTPVDGEAEGWPSIDKAMYDYFFESKGRGKGKTTKMSEEVSIVFRHIKSLLGLDNIDSNALRLKRARLESIAKEWQAKIPLWKTIEQECLDIEQRDIAAIKEACSTIRACSEKYGVPTEIDTSKVKWGQAPLLQLFKESFTRPKPFLKYGEHIIDNLPYYDYEAYEQHGPWGEKYAVANLQSYDSVRENGLSEPHKYDVCRADISKCSYMIRGICALKNEAPHIDVQARAINFGIRDILSQPLAESEIKDMCEKILARRQSLLEGSIEG